MSIRTLNGAVGFGCILLLATASMGIASSPADPPAKSRDKPVAIVGEHPLNWSDLTPQLAEAAGAVVLEETVLGIVLREECNRRGIRIGDAEVRAERVLLGEMLARAARVPVSEAELLIRNARRSRGLGEVRFRALLDRNARLRAMVREGVGDVPISVSPADIDTAYALKYGPRVKARLILVQTQAAATQARTLIDGGRSFGEVAAEMSVDPSAARGGLLDPVSLQDSDYPVAVRRVLESLRPGAVSEPIAVTWAEQTGFAIVQVVENIPAVATAPTRDAAAKELEKEVRVVRERAQMDKLARLLLKGAGVAVMDPSLGWAWEGREK